MQIITSAELYKWCEVHVDQLKHSPLTKMPFRVCQDSVEMGTLMARELVEEIISNNEQERTTRAIIPCGPSSWYKPFCKYSK